MADHPHFNDYSAALEEVFRELLTAPDRAAAIVAFAYLDQTITFGLTQLYGDDEEVSKIERAGYPAERKIELLRGRIHLEEDVIRDLHLIRKTRNRFAHWYEQVTFETGIVRNWCGSLACCRKANLPVSSPRERFMSSAQYVCYRLLVQMMMQVP